ncbi:MAG TPA: septal ring lytic transglycosylase RlpA family protein [Steroidobacteraceae bacterium]|jgi:rare lipoprotein A|nr:septal ring lytic transglycosylase RlpA family protein [Steroidobacteraceae bacterium]
MRRWATAAALLLLLTACAGPPLPSRPQAGPARAGTALPPAPADLARLADAVPRAEPRSALGNPPFYEVGGRRYVVLSSAAGYVERGVASWYGPGFHGLRTSTGEPYDMFAMTAAHKTLPLPCYARVTNLSNGRSVVVRINDRGPFVANRIIDLSYAAATRLGMIRNGTAFVQVQTLTPPFTRAPEAVSVPMPVHVPAVSAASAGVSSVPPVTTQAAGAAVGPGAPGSATFYIQVGAFTQPRNALRAAQRLRAAGFTPILTASPSTGPSLQRVRIGPIDSVQQFDALIARLDALGFSGARLAQD